VIEPAVPKLYRGLKAASFSIIPECTRLADSANLWYPLTGRAGINRGSRNPLNPLLALDLPGYWDGKWYIRL